jgi:hypothetical protein
MISFCCQTARVDLRCAENPQCRVPGQAAIQVPEAETADAREFLNAPPGRARRMTPLPIKGRAALPHGERMPLACGFRRLAGNLVSNFLTPKSDKE